MNTTSPLAAPARYESLNADARAAFWRDARTMLESTSDDDWEALTTGIWLDLLHDESLVAEAWRGLTDPRPDDVALTRVLEISGPVPVHVKQPLLEQLVTNPAWHDTIIRALWFGLFEDHGRIDVPAARALVLELHPTIAASEFDDVCAALEQLPDDAHSFTSWQAAQPKTVERLHLASARAATTLDRRRRERRLHAGSPPAGMQERRVSSDRRGSRPDALTFGIAVDEHFDDADAQHDGTSLVTRGVLAAVCIAIVAVAAWWGNGSSL